VTITGSAATNERTDAQARHLPSLVAALGAVMTEYTAFMAIQAPEDPKMFAARHAAGKAAVGHLAAISRLLQGSATAAPNSEEGAAMVEMLAAARQAMSDYDDGEDNDA
jgi:hypothetical protein